MWSRIKAAVQRARHRHEARALARAVPRCHAALRAADAAIRLARETDFLARSVSYRSARHRQPLTSGATKVELAGLTWWVPAASNPAKGIAGRLIGRGELPFDEIVASRGLTRGRIMIDVGANIGTTSVTRAVLGDFDCIYAAEPDPDNYDCLVRAVTGNGVEGLVLPDRLAIGDVDGEAAFKRASSGTHHLVADPLRVADVVRVPCERLDSWLERLHVDIERVGLVKSDTQGWDIRVLLGAPDVLRHRHIVWQVEFSPAMLRRARCETAFAYEVIRSHFTHFLDMRAMTGPRMRPVSDIVASLAYVESGQVRYTNLLLCNRPGRYT